MELNDNVLNLIYTSIDNYRFDPSTRGNLMGMINMLELGGVNVDEVKEEIEEIRINHLLNELNTLYNSYITNPNIYESLIEKLGEVEREGYNVGETLQSIQIITNYHIEREPYVKLLKSIEHIGEMKTLIDKTESPEELKKIKKRIKYQDEYSSKYLIKYIIKKRLNKLITIQYLPEVEEHSFNIRLYADKASFPYQGYVLAGYSNEYLKYIYNTAIINHFKSGGSEEDGIIITLPITYYFYSKSTGNEGSFFKYAHINGIIKDVNLIDLLEENINQVISEFSEDYQYTRYEFSGRIEFIFIPYATGAGFDFEYNFPKEELGNFYNPPNTDCLKHSILYINREVRKEGGKSRKRYKPIPKLKEILSQFEGEHSIQSANELIKHAIKRKWIPKRCKEIKTEIDETESLQILLFNGHYLVRKSKPSTFSSTITAYNSYSINSFDIETTRIPTTPLTPSEIVRERVHKEVMIGFSRTDIYEGDEYHMVENFPAMFETLRKGVKREDRIYSKNVDKKEVFLKEDHVNILLSFNGSNFDHYLLLSFLFSQVNNPDYQIHKINANGKSYHQIEFSYKDMNFAVFDIAKHGAGESFAETLKAYGCDINKGEYDYDLIKEREEMDVEDWNKLNDYLKLDVMGLLELYRKKNEVITERFKLPDCVNFCSTSQLTYFNFMTNYGGYMTRVFKARSIRDLEMIRRSIYGGRSTVTKRRFQTKAIFDVMTSLGLDYKTLTMEERNEILNKINAWELSSKDHLRYLDINSLYPAAMAMFEYPIGDYTSPDKVTPEDSIRYVDLMVRGEIIAICDCDVTCPKNLVEPRLPSRDGKGGIEWNLYDKLRTCYTSIDIKEGYLYGYEFRVNRIIYWTNTAPIFREYIQDLFDAKKDLAKENLKRTALYSEIKLMLNGLYGKMIQKPYYTTLKIAFAHKARDVEIAYNDNLRNDIINVVWFEGCLIYEVDKSIRKVRDDKGNLTHIEEYDQLKFYTKPHQLGAFTLSYSKQIMWEAFSRLDAIFKPSIFYTDTDSFICHVDDLEKVGDLLGDELGELHDDLGDNKRIINAYFIAPKMYRVDYLSYNEETGECKLEIEMKGKGVPEEYRYEEMYNELIEGREYTTVEMERIFNKQDYKVAQTKVNKGIDGFKVYSTFVTKTISSVYNGKVLVKWDDEEVFLPKGFLM